MVDSNHWPMRHKASICERFGKCVPMRKRDGVRDEAGIVLTSEKGSGKAASFQYTGRERRVRRVDAHTMEEWWEECSQEALTEEGCKCHV